MENEEKIEDEENNRYKFASLCLCVYINLLQI